MSAPRMTVEQQQAHRAAQPPLMGFIHEATAREVIRPSIEVALAEMAKGVSECQRLDREAGK